MVVAWWCWEFPGISAKQNRLYQYRWTYRCYAGSWKADTELKEYQASLVQQGQGSGWKTWMIKTVSLYVIQPNCLPAWKRSKERIGWFVSACTKLEPAGTGKCTRLKPRKDRPDTWKAMDAIRNVAKENGYAYVLDYNAVIVGPRAMMYWNWLKAWYKAPAPKTAAPAPKKN